MFIKDKEYLITLYDGEKLHLLCQKVNKDLVGSTISVDFLGVLNNTPLQLSLETLQNSLDIVQPVNSTEMSQMSTKWDSFHKPGEQQDLKFAYELSKRIGEILKRRSYVHQGIGSFSDYDLKKFLEISAFKVSYEIKNMCPLELNQKLLNLKSDSEFAKTLDVLNEFNKYFSENRNENSKR